MILFITTAVKTSNPTKRNLFSMELKNIVTTEQMERKMT
jgi:hypothetical protein